MPQSRRAFLKQMSAAAGFGLIPGVSERMLLELAPDQLLTEPDEALLRTIALTAVDVARSAGADFADVRVATGRSMVVGCSASYGQGEATPQMGRPRLDLRTEYGIRAIAGGAWGFAGGSELAREAVREVARRAVDRARQNRRRRRGGLELAPAARGETGDWGPPIEQDPFSVPIGEQADLAFAALAEAGRVSGLDWAAVSFRWTRSLRVFASTEGSLIVQRMAVAFPYAVAGVTGTRNTIGGGEEVDVLRSGAYGYEVVARIDLADELCRAGESAVAEARLPAPTPAEIGRYDLVFGPRAVASLLRSTLGEALNLERVLGYYANNEGTSFAAPPQEILGKSPIASPLITVNADRTLAGGAATVGWDDEGVRAGDHTLVQNGIVVDYLSNRETAVELANWYASRDRAAGSNGCASGAGQEIPRVSLPNITLEPGTQAVSAEDLFSGIKRGFYIERTGVTSDQQVLNTYGPTQARWVREIRNGKLGGRVRDLAFQGVTPAFWQSIDAIGGAASRVDGAVGNGRSAADPLQLPLSSVSAVPIRARQVNVLNYGVGGSYIQAVTSPAEE